MVAHGFAPVFIAKESGDCSSIVIDRGKSLGAVSRGLNVHHVMTEVSHRRCIAMAPTHGIAARHLLGRHDGSGRIAAIPRAVAVDGTREDVRNAKR
jgi:hypothetical protein